MDGETLVAAVRDATATERDRLGSEKALVAETNADLSTAAVLRAAADAEARAAATFEQWADDEADDAAREAFADVAARERDHRDRILAALDDTESVDPQADALHDYLRGLEETPARVGGGLVGRPLASERTLLQVVNFFVNEADAARADLFRTLRGDTADLVAEGAALLDRVCESADDYEQARAAAEATVGVAYREYADALEGMGLDPKPVC